MSGIGNFSDNPAEHPNHTYLWPLPRTKADITKSLSKAGMPNIAFAYELVPPPSGEGVHSYAEYSAPTRHSATTTSFEQLLLNPSSPELGDRAKETQDDELIASVADSDVPPEVFGPDEGPVGAWNAIPSSLQAPIAKAYERSWGWIV